MKIVNGIKFFTLELSEVQLEEIHQLFRERQQKWQSLAGVINSVNAQLERQLNPPHPTPPPAAEVPPDATPAE